jgi:hypothetical protein
MYLYLCVCMYTCHTDTQTHTPVWGACPARCREYSSCTHSLPARNPRATCSRYSSYLLYWYKSTNQDILLRLLPRLWCAICQAARRYSAYLLYWYKSTNNGVLLRLPTRQAARRCRARCSLYSPYKYKLQILTRQAARRCRARF